MTKNDLKNQTEQIIENLPEETNWDDLIYRIYVRKKIEKGLSDVKSGKVRTSDNIRKDLGLFE